MNPIIGFKPFQLKDKPETTPTPSSPPGNALGWIFAQFTIIFPIQHKILGTGSAHLAGKTPNFSGGGGPTQLIPSPRVWTTPPHPRPTFGLESLLQPRIYFCCLVQPLNNAELSTVFHGSESLCVHRNSTEESLPPEPHLGNSESWENLHQNWLQAQVGLKINQTCS